MLISAADLHVRGTESIINGIEQAVSVLMKMGYKAIALSIDLSSVDAKLSSKLKVLKRISRSEKRISILYRVNVMGDDLKRVRDLLSKLGKCRTRHYIVGVRPLSKSVARNVVRDRRVSIVYFDPLHLLKFFDESQATLMRDNNVVLEIPFHMFVLNNVLELSIRALSKALRICLKKDCTIIVTSYASSIFELRSPYQLASLLSVVGVPLEMCLPFVSSRPMKIAEEKLGG